MKTIIRIFLLLFLQTQLFNAASGHCQQAPSIPLFATTNDTCIKYIGARYLKDTVYLTVKINGLEKTSFYFIERSLDGVAFEDIGSFKHYGTTVKVNIMKCFKDSDPYMSCAFYRVVRYDDEGKLYTSEIVSVTPECRDKSLLQSELAEKKEL